MKTKSLKLNIFFNGLRVLMQMIFPLISFPYASRILLPDGIGAVNFANSITAYFVMFASLGISTYAIREGAKLRNDIVKLSLFVQEIFYINVFTTMVSYLFFVLMLVFVKDLHAYNIILFISSLSIICTPLGIDWLYGAIEDYQYITIRSIIFQIFSLIILFTFVKKSTDLYMYAFVTVFSVVGSNICNLINSRKIITWQWFGWHSYDFFRHLKPILTIFGLNIACNVYMNLDKTMLGFITNDYQVGLYTTAYKVVGIIVSLINSIGNVMLPRISYQISIKNKSSYLFLLENSFNYMLIIAIPMTIGAILYSSHIILLLSGPDYSKSILAMQILSLLIIFSGLGNAISLQIFISNGYEKYSLYASMISAIVNLICNFYLIPIFKIEGAAISTIISEFFALILCIVLSSKIVNIKPLFNSIFSYFIASLIIIPIYLFVNSICSNTVLQLLMGVIISTFAYFIMLYVFKNKYLLFIVKNRIKFKSSK